MRSGIKQPFESLNVFVKAKKMLVIDFTLLSLLIAHT